MKRALLFALFLGACAASHAPGDGDGDASTSHDGAVVHHDGATSDATTTGDAGTGGGGGGEHVTCGPNVCRSGEICCNERCGVCAFPTECVDYGCVGGP